MEKQTHSTDWVVFYIYGASDCNLPIRHLPNKEITPSEQMNINLRVNNNKKNSIFDYKKKPGQCLLLEID
jgi:hypothetical protein